MGGFYTWARALLATGLAHAGPAESRHLASRDIVLSASLQNDQPVTAARSWIRAAGTPDWVETPCDWSQGALRLRLPSDGEFDIHMTLHNEVGDSAAPPTRSDVGHARVVIDTLSPVLHVHGAEWPADASIVSIGVTLVEENLAPDGLQVFYRPDVSADWMPGGPAVRTGELLVWTPPDGVQAALDLCVVAADRAGNQARQEIRVERPMRPAPVASIPEVIDVPPASQPAPPERGVAPHRIVRAQQLAEQGREFARQANWPLAVARLQAAHEMDSPDRQIRIDLAQALIRTGKLDGARTHLESVLAAEPAEAGALENLALIAATQSRYADAVALLRRLLAVRPDHAETWIRLGDLQHRLGRSTEALQAWRKAGHYAADRETKRKVEMRLKYLQPADANPDSAREKARP